MLGNILAVGLMSMGMGMSGVKDEPKKVVRAQEAITFFGDYTYDQLAYLTNKVNDGPRTVSFDVNGNISTTTIVKLEVQAMQQNQYQWRAISDSNASTVLGVVNTGAGTKNSSSNVTLTQYPTEWTYYLNEEEPPEPTMGESIIGSIASGLGIIGALATTFLTGFGNLFYSSGALTPFAIFSLVMLGIAVSFAVVKLVLNLIRSNTGA